MMNGLLAAAEMISRTEPFWQYGQPPQGLQAVGVVFVLLMCAGVAVDAGLIITLIKRPAHLSGWRDALATRALPGRQLALIAGGVILLYLLNSTVYALLFPFTGLGAHTVLFQALFFQIPALGGIFWLLQRAGFSAQEPFGLFRGKHGLRLLGLSLLLYLAALPLLWFYSAIYQFFLQQIGHTFYLQDVAQVLAAPAPWSVRTCLLLIAVVIAPVFEEILFRGLLLPFLVRRIGLTAGIMVVSVLFGGLHLHVPSLFPLFLLSVLFCCAFAATRSLLVPIGMHAAFNGVTVLLLSLMNSG